MEPVAADLDSRAPTQLRGTVGTAIGALGALLALAAAGIAVIESWRVWERCAYAAPPAGMAGSSVESRPSLFPLGYQCVWTTGETITAVTFANWPLTAAVLTGVLMVAVGGWMVARSRRVPRMQ